MTEYYTRNGAKIVDGGPPSEQPYIKVTRSEGLVETGPYAIYGGSANAAIARQAAEDGAKLERAVLDELWGLYRNGHLGEIDDPKFRVLMEEP